MYGVSSANGRPRRARGPATWLFLFVIGAASCREHRELCEGEGCALSIADDTVPGASGASGASGAFSGPNELAGAGGVDAGPECSRFAHCDNGLACDGVERCVDGRCEAGTSSDCAHGTHCVEEDMERCVYETSSPWLLATTQEQVKVLRLAELAARETTMIPLAEHPRQQAFVGFYGAFWSPNAKFALVRSFEQEFASSYQLMRFGGGLPSIGDVLDLPNWGDYWDAPQFQPDSSQARVLDGYSGSYVVDLTRDPPVAERHQLGDFYWSEGGCNDGKSWVRVDHEYGVHLDTIVEGTPTSRSLGEYYSQVSPDGSLVLLTTGSSEEGQVVLTRCSDDPWTFEIDDAFDGEFSPNAKLLWLRLNDGGVRVLSLEEPAAPVEVWASSAARDVYALHFSPDSRRLLFEQAGEEDEPSVHIVVDFGASPQPQAHELTLVPGVVVFYTGNDAALLIESDRYFWQSLTSSEPPRLVLDRTDDQSFEIAQGFLEEGSFFVQRGGPQQSELLKLQIAADGFELTPLATFEGVAITAPEIAPDHSGVVVGATTNFIDNKLYWVALPLGAPAEKPALLLERATWWGFQREPP